MKANRRQISPNKIPKHIVVLYENKNAVSYAFPFSRRRFLNVSNNVIVTATPRMLPIFLESARIPDASPSSFGVTLVIMALLDGD